MGKTFWTPVVIIACVFWGAALLLEQGHPHVLIPMLGSYLLAFGVTLGVMYFWHGRKG